MTPWSNLRNRIAILSLSRVGVLTLASAPAKAVTGRLAIEAAGRLEQGAGVAARQALEALQVPIGGGATRLPLARLVPAGQLQDLEELLERFAG